MSISALSKSSVRRHTANHNTALRSAAIKRKGKDKEEITQRAMVKAALKPMAVSSPDDPEEKEADNTADKVLRMPQANEKELALVSPKIARSEVDEPEVKTKRQDPQISRKANASVNMGANVQADIQRATANGSPLPLSVRRFMEPRFGADFSAIKIHTDSRSAKLNRRLSARAFAYTNHIFFGDSQFAPDSQDGKRLIAHELTHTIQQGAAQQRSAPTTSQASPAQKPIPAKQSETQFRRQSSATAFGANTTNISQSASLQTSTTMRKSATPVKVNHQTQPSVQRLGISDALDYFADKAHFIPGFRMLSILLGVNPINMSRVDRSAANILRAIVEFLPGGAIITTVLDRYGIFERAGSFVSRQLNSLAITGASIKRSLNAFLDRLSWTDIFDLAGVWERAKRLFTEPISRIINFARGIFTALLKMIKDAILMPLAQWASSTRGWDLLIAVLGRNPITGEVVERTPENLIGGFMRLIGQQEVWENIKRANAIPRAWAWFQATLVGVLGFVSAIPFMLRQTLETLQVQDLLSIPSVFARILGTFASFAFSFVRWAGAQVIELLKIIFEVVAPGLMPFLRRAKSSFISIISNPISFVRNLIQAGIMGFRQFSLRFLTHLRAGFIGWLTGSLAGAGVHIPASFSFKEILKFILSVLGVTWQRVRLKLVKAVGEPAVAAMEKGFKLVKTLITEGPGALYKQLKIGLANLKEQVIEGVMNFVLTKVIQAAVVRIVSMLNPAGAFVQAILAIYNTVMFFVQRMRTIAQVARSLLNSIMNIAEGKLKPAANRVERSLAGLLSLSISFLARLMGLGNIAKPIQDILKRIRKPVDNAMDKAINWVVAQAKRAGSFILQAGVPSDPKKRLTLGLRAAKAVVKRMPLSELGEAVITKALAVIKIRYGFKELVPRVKNGSWWVHGSINPEGDIDTETPVGGASTADQIDILDSSGAVQIQNYSREKRSGDLKPALTSGSDIILSQIRFQQGANKVTNAASSTLQINYSIAQANSFYAPPKRIAGIVDSDNEEEHSTYAGHRDAFSRHKRKWWRESDSTAPDIAWLIDKGWLFPGNKKGLMGGTRKWQYIYDHAFNSEARTAFGPRSTVSKTKMQTMFTQDPGTFKAESYYQIWSSRIGEQTEIHHMLPLDFGGTNSQTFIPISRDKHTKNSDSIHLSFWNPMKRWLLNLRTANNSES